MANCRAMPAGWQVCLQAPSGWRIPLWGPACRVAPRVGAYTALLYGEGARLRAGPSRLLLGLLETSFD